MRRYTLFCSAVGLHLQVMANTSLTYPQEHLVVDESPIKMGTVHSRWGGDLANHRFLAVANGRHTEYLDSLNQLGTSRLKFEGILLANGS